MVILKFYRLTLITLSLENRETFSLYIFNNYLTDFEALENLEELDLSENSIDAWEAYNG